MGRVCVLIGLNKGNTMEKVVKFVGQFGNFILDTFHV